MSIKNLFKQKNTIWVILLVGFVLRMSIPIVAVYLSPDDRSIFHNKDDTWSYVRPAIGLVNEGKFVSEGKPETYRTPGYPLILVPGVILGHVELVTVGIQVISSCLTIWFVYLVAKTLFKDERIALFSAALYMFEPLSVIQTSLLQTETAYSFTLMVSLFLTLRYLQSSSLSDLLGAGVVLSVGYYIRPASYLLPTMLAIMLAIRAMIGPESRARFLVHVCLFLLVSTTPLFLWQARNKVETGNFQFSSITGLGGNLYFGLARDILALESGISRVEVSEKIGYGNNEVYFEHNPEQRGWSDAQIDDYRKKEALKIFFAHPFQFLRVFMVRAAWIMVGPGLSDWLYIFNVKLERMDKVLENKRDSLRLLRGPWLGLAGTIFLAGMLAIYWILALAGLITRRHGSIEGTIFLVMTVAYIDLLTALSGTGYSRYRHPIMPIVCVFAGNGLSVIVDRWASRNALHNRT